MCIETCLTQIHNPNPYLTSLFIVFVPSPQFSSIKPIHTFIFAKCQRTFSLVLFLHNLITMKPVVLRKLSNSQESSLRKLSPLPNTHSLPLGKWELIHLSPLSHSILSNSIIKTFHNEKGEEANKSWEFAKKTGLPENNLYSCHLGAKPRSIQIFRCSLTNFWTPWIFLIISVKTKFRFIIY